jgi:hypothetical protein
VFPNPRFGCAYVALIAIVMGSTNGASAITVEVAKKCEALTAKAFPPRVPGNPAAGSAKGNGLAQRDYFNKCLANSGNTDDQASKETK